MDQELRVLLSSESNEWYTPEYYIDLARQVMDGIDLDPASSEIAQQTVAANVYYDKDQDGLSRDWVAYSVWLNPPYGKTNGKSGESNQWAWARYLIGQYRKGNVGQAVLLTKAALGYDWFAKVRAESDAYAYTHHLIRHVRPGQKEEKAKPAKLGSAFFYFGPEPERFVEIFRVVGEAHITPKESKESEQKTTWADKYEQPTLF